MGAAAVLCHAVQFLTPFIEGLSIAIGHQRRALRMDVF